MTIDRALEIVEQEWDQQGFCDSCGWHAALNEHNAPAFMTINEEYSHIRLPCANPELPTADHRGVRIYYDGE